MKTWAKRCSLMVLACLLMLSVLVGCSELDSLSNDYIELAVGDTITLGRYEQDGSTYGGGEDIEWIVLDQRGAKFLLLSKNALALRPYHDVNSGVTWETSDTRVWLNSTFYDECFKDVTDAELICSTTIDTPDNPQYGTSGGNPTIDKLFLLSVDEALKYFKTDAERKSTATKAAVAGTDFDTAANWALRTTGSAANMITSVSATGAVLYEGAACDTAGFAIRPAMWIDISDRGLTEDFKNKAGKKIEDLINKIPTRITDYATCEKDIMEAYLAYTAIEDAEWQGRISNKDRLLSVMEGLNKYKADQVRIALAGITPENIKDGTLERFSKLYLALTEEQLACLTAEDIAACENMMKVSNVVMGIENLINDTVKYYSTFASVKASYASLSAENKALVYNAADMDMVDKLYAMQSNLVFTAVEGGGWSVKAIEGGANTIKGELVIPPTYQQAPVLVIEVAAFENCRGITSVTIPDSVTTIGKGAFKGCNNIETMTLPFTGKSVDAIGFEGVFGFIFGYETKEARGTSNPSEEFINQQYDNVEQAVWQYTRDNNYGGTDSLQSFFYYIPTSIKHVTITNQSTVMAGAFNGCKTLETVNYTKTLEAIGAAALQNCEALISFNTKNENTIELAGEIEKLGAYAFAGCAKITTVNFDEDITVIEDGVFAECKEITSITLPSKVTYIGDYAFKGLKRITNIVVHDTTTVIGRGAFQGCNALENVTIPFTGRTVDAVNYDAVFGYIFGYETQQAKGSSNPNDTYLNKKYGEVIGATWQYSRANYYGDANYPQSFYYYIPNSIKNVTITNQTVVNTAAFNGCKFIEKITYRKTIESFGIAAFQNCESLAYFNSETMGTANLTSEAPKIPDFFMNNCPAIDTVTFPKGVQEIGQYAFVNCQFTSVEVPDTVVAIRVGAFKGCNALQSIKLPFIGESETAVHYSAVFGFIFGYETQQAKNTSSPNDTYLDSKYGDVVGATWQYSRANYYNDTKYPQSYYYYIPASLKVVTITKQTKVPIAAFNNCTNLTAIVFEKTITSEGQYAFQNCTDNITGRP